MEPQWTIPLGESAELIADKHKISREQQDEFALASHQKAAAAQRQGLFDAELAPVSLPQRKGEAMCSCSKQEMPSPRTHACSMAQLYNLPRRR